MWMVVVHKDEDIKSHPKPFMLRKIEQDANDDDLVVEEGRENGEV